MMQIGRRSRIQPRRRSWQRRQPPLTDLLGGAPRGQADLHLGEGHGRVSCDDLSGGAVARVSPSEKGENHLRIGNRLVDIAKSISGLLEGLAYSWTDISP